MARNLLVLVARENLTLTGLGWRTDLEDPLHGRYLLTRPGGHGKICPGDI